MTDEKEDQPPFRWNRQAVFMLMFFMLAMALPLGGVLWFTRGYLYAQQRAAIAAPLPKTDITSLEKGLERMSDAQFASAVTLKDDSSVELQVAKEDMPPRIVRIEEIAKEAGGSGLEMSGSDPTVRRVVIQIPASRSDVFKRAIQGDRVDFSAIPSGAATRMIEVDLRAP